ncbi:hypothetical protein PanWU01x14_128990 [Parasponia andersonii]|uniref:Uncharacterized protein n=1 Tax=Parasponia andersonii TaxID=3476 RepID=A0A2P5CRS8_PARAD|nr:hypothetical protein PanWU01x14_128990 [Parasponia andersonii]
MTPFAPSSVEPQITPQTRTKSSLKARFCAEEDELGKFGVAEIEATEEDFWERKLEDTAGREVTVTGRGGC